MIKRDKPDSKFILSWWITRDEGKIPVEVSELATRDERALIVDGFPVDLSIDQLTIMINKVCNTLGANDFETLEKINTISK